MFALDELIVGCYEIALMRQLSCFLILHVMMKSKEFNTKFGLKTAYVILKRYSLENRRAQVINALYEP